MFQEKLTTANHSMCSSWSWPMQWPACKDHPSGTWPQLRSHSNEFDKEEYHKLIQSDSVMSDFSSRLIWQFWQFPHMKHPRGLSRHCQRTKSSTNLVLTFSSEVGSKRFRLFAGAKTIRDLDPKILPRRKTSKIPAPVNFQGQCTYVESMTVPFFEKLIVGPTANSEASTVFSSVRQTLLRLISTIPAFVLLSLSWGMLGHDHGT